MDYIDYSREQLLERIKSIEMLNKELLKEKEQEARLEYAWTGNLGHWYWNIATNEVYFNPLKITTLGYEMSDIQEKVTYQFFTDKLHPEDYQKTMDSMTNHLYGKADVYEAEYRIQAKDGRYKWYYDRGKITQRDENGKALFLAGIVFDITEKKETQLELEQKNIALAELSSIDGLTKIYNHRTLMIHLESESTKAAHAGEPLCIAIFDIDDFKKVNDNKGHVFGDQVLFDVANIIKKSIRVTDAAGRYGGEEFMVILKNTEIKSAISISERIRKAVEKKLFAGDINITISGGVRQYNGESTTEFINNADKHLYEAKKCGKNQIRF